MVIRLISYVPGASPSLKTVIPIHFVPRNSQTLLDFIALNSSKQLTKVPCRHLLAFYHLARSIHLISGKHIKAFANFSCPILKRCRQLHRIEHPFQTAYKNAGIFKSRSIMFHVKRSFLNTFFSVFPDISARHLYPPEKLLLCEMPALLKRV